MLRSPQHHPYSRERSVSVHMTTSPSNRPTFVRGGEWWTNPWGTNPQLVTFTTSAPWEQLTMLMPAPTHPGNSNLIALKFYKNSPGDTDVQPRLRTTGWEKGQFTATSEWCFCYKRDQEESPHKEPTLLHPILHFQPPELWEHKCLLFKPHRLRCYGVLLWQPKLREHQR